MLLAQITDLHLRWHQPGTSRLARRRSREMPELFAAALARCVDLGADAIAVTGDLLDVPDYILRHDDYHDHDWAFWREAVLADYRLLRELLDGCGRPYLVLPGNHDQIAWMAEVFPPEPLVRDLAGYRLACFWDRDLANHVPRRLDRERALFEALLADAASPPQVHLQHYVITPELNQGWPHTYAEGAELCRRMAASGRVALALSGHYHRGTARFTVGRTCFTTTPAFAEFPHPFRLYELADGRVTIAEEQLLAEPRTAGRPALILDRDGVLNQQPSYRTGPEPLLLIPSAGQALRRAREAGYALVAVSNQSCIGHGYATHDIVDSVFDRLGRLLWEDGWGYLDAFAYAATAGARSVTTELAADDHPKPDPHHLLALAEALGLDLSRSYMIGDHLSDLEAGLAAGAEPVLVRTGGGQRSEAQLPQRPDLAAARVYDDLPAAVASILG